MVTYTDIQSPFFILFVRVILPNGLPEEFSTACTFRARKLPKYTWHIIRIVDMENEPQFLIAMNPKIQTLDLSVKNQTGELETVSFSADRVSKIFTTLLEIMLLISVDYVDFYKYRSSVVSQINLYLFFQIFLFIFFILLDFDNDILLDFNNNINWC